MKKNNADVTEHVIESEIRKEMRFIIALSCGKISRDEVISHIKPIIDNINWRDVIDKAIKYQLLPILYYNLKNIIPDMVPEEILEEMRGYYQNNLIRSMIQTKELLQIIQICNDHQIPVIPYKGLVLSALVYGDIGLRVSSDIDIIVHKSNVLRLKNLLVSNGYKTFLHLAPYQEDTYLLNQCEYNLIHPKKTTVEIHWQFAPKYSLSFFEEEIIWDNSYQRSFEGKEITVLSHEMQIIALSVHAGKHEWNNIRHICDLAGFISKTEQVNWNRVMHYAKEYRINQLIFLGLGLVERLTKVTIPVEISRKIKADKKVQYLIQDRIEQIFSERLDATGEIQHSKTWISFLDSYKDKIHTILFLCFIPTSDDWKIVTLNKKFSFLYYIIRPLRLLHKFVLKGG
ncbi:nucleotidyltransferase domain-containing protein [Methanospirillum sp.]